MSYEFEIVLNVLITSLPYRLLSYYPFWDRLRFQKRTVIGIIISSQFAFLIIFFLFARGNINLKVTEYIFAIICFIIYCCCVQVTFGKQLFFYMLITAYAMIIRGIAIFLTAAFFTGHAAQYFSRQNSLIQFFAFLTALPLMILLFRKTAERILETDDSPIWKTIWLVPALTIAVILIFTGSLNEDLIKNWKFLATRICLLICTFAVYHVLLRSLDTVREHAVLKERAKQAETINVLQKNQYALLKKKIEETRMARHDLRQHLNLIQAYLDDGDTAALKDYLMLYKRSLPEDTTDIYCSNYAIDVVIRYYAQQAKINQIAFYTKLELPAELAVSEPDICVIFGNLLENALEACQRKKKGEKFIRIGGRIIGAEAISLTVDNSYGEEPIRTGADYRSSKRDEIGIGLHSVQHIAKKYEGVVNLTHENGIFYTSVMLNPNS